jgi:lysophospholipase L1-like esterase
MMRPSSLRGRRLAVALGAGLLIVVMCAVAGVALLAPSGAGAGAGAGARTAAAASAGTYVALGDSYSSGVGAGSPIRESGACLRSRRAYPYGLGRTVTSFRACGGARTDDVLASQLDPFPSDTRLVTITIGGNDAGFADVIERCLFGSRRACSTRVERAERFVRGELAARLRRVYEAIRDRAPQATVVVAGYPRLFARRPWCSPIGTIDSHEQRRLNEGANLLARTIAAEVARHQGFRFVDVREAFNGGGVCASSPRILGVASPEYESFHPTARGQQTYARVIRRRL